MGLFTRSATALLLASASLGASAATYQLDPTHTSVVMSWSHFGFSHPTANFSDITGTIDFDASKPAEAAVKVSIPVKTVDTHVPALTKEFLAEPYFNVAKYPTATFVSNKVVAKGNNHFAVHGLLTIKGISKPVVLKATLNKQGMQPMEKKPAVGFDAITTIKRSDFGMGQYVPAVSDAVTIRLSTEAVQH